MRRRRDASSIAAATSLQQRASEVREFLLKCNVPIDNLNEVLLYIQEESQGTSDVLCWFLTNYEDVWTEWIPTDVAARVNAAAPTLMES